ncbi:glycoside hydrolase family 16 protein [Streptacidiphilus carbonis]|uniref:glycoside hydrolase family 16 protein n=1 Tax=Streptacidiphilus carbonis TaxID=105422 RepID=UPI0012699BBD|nr:beta-glucanase [Streptacidiphilus carbonis]
MSALRLLAAVALLALFLPTPAARAGAPRAGAVRAQALVFDEEFNSPSWGHRGAVWTDTTVAYEDGRSDRRDAKLDQLQPGAMSISHGALNITAKARTAHGSWGTGLLSTEPSASGTTGGNGFQLRAGDYVVARLKLPGRQDGGGHGAWPGIWTWRGGNEVDVVEWHSETPDIAEFANHSGGADSFDFHHSPLVGFGKWITVAVRIGATDVSWYLGDDTHGLRLAKSDHTGVGADWHAYLIANLSVSAQPGRFPASTHPITMQIDRIRVYR